MNIRPLQDRILVQPILEKEVRKGGIIIPDSAKEKPIEGRVKAVGKGKIGEDGKPVKLEIKVGDKVLYSKYGGTEIKIDGEDYLLMREDDVLGVIEK
ncbi:MAG: co-chaperone GroES [Nitrospinaceae bacterium]|jgi:chaperonin GroES|nr:co-chaperone GroES [Nitrospinota bacterium]MDP6334770.1 co-chaperone GroES [Nitrospinaceae bacterium]HAX46801.1 co-chaperone GroES [Nitrospina sp.]MDP7147351.1 co-chaperone GroES [Nitrospinaceae bacterium]MDP7556794.1 co-chaperone GroES [Nitrospinaceae bacterium]|tara:strand:+ start:3084 stop:3374 length:291 start_codon:yes stop_codon:yes gene_type:complete